jgi:transposase
MMVRKAFRFRLEPTPEQTQVRARVAGCVRFGWNKGFRTLISAACAAIVPTVARPG